MRKEIIEGWCSATHRLVGFFFYALDDNFQPFLIPVKDSRPSCPWF